MSDSLPAFLSYVLVGVRNAAMHNEKSRVSRELELAVTLRHAIDSKSGVQRIDEAVGLYSSDAIADSDNISIERFAGYEDRVRRLTASPEEFTRNSLFADLLDIGLRRMSECKEKELFELVELEADHVHNVPLYAFQYTEEAAAYYHSCERKLFVEKIDKLGLSNSLDDFAEVWRVLEG